MTTRRKDLTATAGPLLFDLPLEEPAHTDEVSPQVVAVAARIAEAGVGPTAEQIELTEEYVEAEEPLLEQDDKEETPAPSRGPVIAGIGPRLLSGLADLFVHAGVLAAAALGLYAMAATPRLHHWPAFLVLMVTFSFFYTVVSLAFWGQTAGMAWCDLFSRDRLTRPLTFRQAALRWLGGLLSMLLAGVPVLLAYRGTSLTDLMSASVTYQQPIAD